MRQALAAGGTRCSSCRRPVASRLRLYRGSHSLVSRKAGTEEFVAPTLSVPQRQNDTNHRELYRVIPAVNQKEPEASACKEVVDADT